MAFGISGITAEYRFQWNRHTWDIEPQFAVPGLQLRWVDILAIFSSFVTDGRAQPGQPDPL